MGIFKRFLSGKAKEPTNPNLLRAMRVVAEGGNAEALHELHKELLTSSLLIPTTSEIESLEPGGWLTLSLDLDVKILTARYSEGQIAMAAFTDIDALRSWRPEGNPYIALGGPDLFGIAASQGIAAVLVNPAGPVGGEITRQEIKMLAEGVIPYQETRDSASAQVSVPQGTNLMIGAPAVPPAPELVDQLRAVLDEHTKVSEAYLFQMVMGKGAPHLVIGLKLDGEVAKLRIEEIAQAIMNRIQPSLSPDEFVDLMILDREELLQTVKNFVPPVFER